MSARPDRRDDWDAPQDLDLRSMPSFLAHPPAANDAAGHGPLLRDRRRSLALPLAAGLGIAAAIVTGAAFLYGGAPAAPPAPAAVVERAPAIARSEPVPPAPVPNPAGLEKPRETITASAAPIALPAPVEAPPAPEPAVKEVARLETTPPALPLVEAPVAPPAPARPAAMPAAEVERALRRAETLLEQGDISAARLFLERAAEGGNGRALFRLAETYDPRALQRWGARGIKGSPEKARELYRKAQAAGEAEAGARLAGLR